MTKAQWILNDAGFARRPQNSFVRHCEVGLAGQGSFAILQVVIVELEKGGFEAFAKTDNDADGPSYIYKSTPIGTFETPEEAIAACTEWEAIENGKRILMPENYRKKEVGVDWISVQKGLHLSGRNMGKTAAAMAAIGKAIHDAQAGETMQIISKSMLKPNDKDKP